jgi:hypothetical protein
MSAEIRTTFRYDQAEAAFAARVMDPASAEAEAVRRLTGHTDLAGAPVTVLTHALIRAGMRAIEAETMQVGHERLAAFLRTDHEHRAWADSRRKRRSERPVEPT